MKLNRITTLFMLSSLSLLANAAPYTIEELPTEDLSLNQFGSAIDNTGLVLVTLNSPFNPPIDLSLIDLSIFTLNDPDGAAQGDFDDTDYNVLGSYIYSQTSNNSLTGQKLASQIVYKTDGTDVDYVFGLDQETDGTNGFTFAQKTTIAGSQNGTHIVGTMAGPFRQLNHTTEDGVEVVYTINDFNLRGFIQVGDTVTELVPDDLSGGGVSTAKAINAGLQVAGTTSIGPQALLSESIEQCLDDDERPLDEPADVCLYRIRLASDSFSQFTNRRASIWQLDSAGQVLSQTNYGLVFEPDEDVTIALSTEANDINDAGVAVGASSAPISTTYANTAVVFENGETIRIIEDEDLMPNTATGINNNGYVVGYQSKLVSRVLKTIMFVHNRSTQEVEFLDGFFVNSSTIPRAINNQNLVVGEAESEATQGTRRRSGFIYNIEEDTFTDLNALISCDADMDIVAANDINDSGEIIADALVKRPARDLRGEVLLDSDGQEVLVDSVVAVKLTPTGEAASDCDLSEEDSSLAERQGAGVGFLTIAGLLLISVFRKRNIYTQ